jgi:hypothetical protein
MIQESGNAVLGKECCMNHKTFDVGHAFQFRRMVTWPLCMFHQVSVGIVTVSPIDYAQQTTKLKRVKLMKKG